MSAELPHEKKGTWTTFVLKLIFFVGAFLLIVFTVLANMGGKSDALKGSIEQFARDSTGMEAKIATLNNMNFFPTVAFDFTGMDLFRQDAPKVPAVHIDHLRAALGFWDITFSNGKMKILEIAGIKAMPGVIFDRTVMVESAAIVDEGGGVAAFEGKGAVGSDPLFFSMGMEVLGSGRSKKYRFGQERAFIFEIGGVKLEALIKNGEDPYLVAENIKISFQGQNVITGGFELLRRTSHELKIVGEFTFPEHGTVIKPELVFDTATRRITGEITSDNFKPADFAAGSAFARLAVAMLTSVGSAQDQKDFLDRFFAKQGIKLKTSGEVSYEGPLVFENNILKIQ